jgi:hypothetical protein
MCQEGVHFVPCIFQQELPQEGDPPSRQVLNPVIWAGLLGQLGANAYALHLMQLRDFLPPSHWGRDAAHSHQFFTDDDKDLINAKIAHMLHCMDRNQVMANDLLLLSVVVNAMNLQGLLMALEQWKEAADQED